ncbi:MAG TPA: GYD domain-containing protein, partial [Actinomycetota bacterium]
MQLDGEGDRELSGDGGPGDAANEAFGKLGGRLVDLYWTLGQYDVVAIMEFPDDETATAAAVALGGQGNIRTQTLRAFGREEMTAILSKLPG